MNLRASVSALCLGAALAAGATDARAFGFGLLGGCGSCCSPVCCDPCCAPPTVCPPPVCYNDSCCDPCCAPRCGLLSGLKGMFHRHHGCGCCEPACGCEPSCAAEPSCGCDAEPACGCEADACCDPCCAPRRCRLLDGLKGLFHRHHGCGCCEPACGCEDSCGCEPSCAAEPSCGC